MSVKITIELLSVGIKYSMRDQIYDVIIFCVSSLLCEKIKCIWL